MPRPTPLADDRFQRLLQERAQRLADSGARAVTEPRVNGLGILTPGDSWIGADTVADLYGSEPSLPVEADAAPSPEAPPASLAEPSAVAGELALKPDLSPEELARLRRSFALDNHPDRVAPDQRELATRRMSAANALIDGALRTRTPGSR